LSMKDQRGKGSGQEQWEGTTEFLKERATSQYCYPKDNLLGLLEMLMRVAGGVDKGVGKVVREWEGCPEGLGLLGLLGLGKLL
jgi:hypothetical protein